MIDPKHLTKAQAAMLEELDWVEVTINVARDYFDNGVDLGDDFDTALDNAQGHVFSGAGDVAYVLIRITQ